MPRGDGHISFVEQKATVAEPDEDYYDLLLHDLLPEGLDPRDWQPEPESEPEPESAPEPEPEPDPESSNQLRVTAFFTVRKVQCISPAINFSPLKDRRRTATAMPIALPLIPPTFTAAGPVALECHERLDWNLVEARGPLFVQVV